MTDQSQKSPPETSEDTHSIISSAELWAGAAPSSSPDGRTPDLFGQVPAHASPIPPPENKKAQKMKETYGLSGSGSCEDTLKRSETFQRSLASRWQALLPTDGSTECILTWKDSVTPSGRLYSRLAASMRPTDAIESGLWPTPQASEGEKENRTPEGAQRELQTRNSPSLTSHVLALWATPRAGGQGDTARVQNRTGKRHAGDDLTTQALAASALWTTPSTRDHKDSPGMVSERKDGKSRHDQLPRQVFGTLTIGSSAATVKPGASPQLNPAFVFWLMGFPKEWVSSVQRGMQSVPQRGRSS